MAASYPAGFDTMSDPGSNLSGPPLHSTMHNQINDVVEAIEAELGLNPSGAYATVAAALTAVATRVGGTWRRVATQTVLTATNSLIVWDTEDVDTTGFLPTPSTTFTVPSGQAGLYDISCRIGWGGDPVLGFIQIVCSTAGTYAFYPGNSLSIGGAASVAGIPLAVAETVQINVYQTSGVARTAVGRLDIYKRDI